ncbi:hypothetical protein [Haladaptatus sp. DYF46]|nr:hypothetical protein [Haladaptatus sp. DYF46]
MIHERRKTPCASRNSRERSEGVAGVSESKIHERRKTQYVFRNSRE